VGDQCRSLGSKNGVSRRSDSCSLIHPAARALVGDGAWPASAVKAEYASHKCLRLKLWRCSPGMRRKVQGDRYFYGAVVRVAEYSHRARRWALCAQPYLRSLRESLEYIVLKYQPGRRPTLGDVGDAARTVRSVAYR